MKKNVKALKMVAHIKWTLVIWFGLHLLAALGISYAGNTGKVTYLPQKQISADRIRDVSFPSPEHRSETLRLVIEE